MAKKLFAIAAPVTLSVFFWGLPAWTQAQSGLSQTSSLRRLIDRILRGPEDEGNPPKTARPITAQCLISPAVPGTEATTWHNQPTFVWQGELGHFKVVNTENDEVLWEYTPSAEETHIRYAGVPLHAGQYYKWQIYESEHSDSAQYFPEFKIVDAETHQDIENHLATIDEEMASTPEVTDEAIAISKAQYFIDESLEIDAIQTLFSVEDPTQDLVIGQQEILEQSCETQEATHSL